LLGDAQQLHATLNRLDGKGYKAYRDIQGAWQFNGFRLIVDHCQGDPYAAPSRLRVQVRVVGVTLLVVTVV
jgi:predicted ABC-class ATPase